MLAGLDINLVIRNYFMFILTLFCICHHMYLQDSNALLLMFGHYFIYFGYHKMIWLYY